MQKRFGLTLVEMMVACVIVALLSLSVFGVASSAALGRVRDQDVLVRQQALAQALSIFSEDVRSSAGLAAPTATSFTLRHPLTAGGFTFISYRLAGDRFQRGETPVRLAAPTTWADVFDAEQFRVASGSFAYYSLGNGGSASSLTTRRIELANLKLMSRRMNEAVSAPAISAVMRESANARDLVASCTVRVLGHWPSSGSRRGEDDDGRGGGGGGSSRCTNNGHRYQHGDRDDHEDGCGDDDDDWERGDDHTRGCDRDSRSSHEEALEDCWNSSADANGNVHVRSCVQNLSGTAITISAFTMSWQDGNRGDLLSSLKLGLGRWGTGTQRFASGGAIQAFRRNVTIGAGESAPLALHFKYVPAKLDNIAMQFYASTDTAHLAPYVVAVDLPD